jgi:hypothetical protein
MVRCLHCHAEFDVPGSLSAEQRADVVALARAPGRYVHAMKLLVGRHGVSFRHAKGIVFHLALPGPTCRSCHAAVASDPVTECARCRSLVINW